MNQLMRFGFGAAIVMLVLFQIGREVAGSPLALTVAETGLSLCLLGVLAALAIRVRGGVRLFVVVALALTGAEVALNPDGWATVRAGLLTSGFFLAFFCALTTLRNAASTSPAMESAGTYLARQPPGRRYLALSVGAQAFSILLNYGAINLLGSLALASARAETDDRIRTVRTRRMLLAIHRGFVSSLCWSPLSFSIAIASAVIPGTSWAQVAVPGLFVSALIIATGWALDRYQGAGRRGLPRPDPGPAGRWTSLLPLLGLLILMLTLLVTLAELTQVRVLGLVLMIVPGLSLGWVILQLGGLRGLAPRIGGFLATELPGYRKEMLLIASAGYIGAVGSGLIRPHMAELGLDLAAVPTGVLLIGLVLVMPILGQLGANPILSMSLIGPLLPPAATLGISPTALAMALICGWTMTGVTSPFTATNLLIGRFGGIRPIEVGWVWNRSYFLVTTVLLCVWTLVYAFGLG